MITRKIIDIFERIYLLNIIQLEDLVINPFYSEWLKVWVSNFNQAYHKIVIQNYSKELLKFFSNYFP